MQADNHTNDKMDNTTDTSIKPVYSVSIAESAQEIQEC